MKVFEAIDAIRAFHPPMRGSSFLDRVLFGDDRKECSGIAVTCYATPEVIRAAAERGANLLIVHEPLFYNNFDETGWLAGEPVFQKKTELLQKAGMVVWRDHDYIHAGPPAKENKEFPDGIFHGIMQELGWEPYLDKWPNMPLIYQIPPVSARKLARDLLEKFELNGMRILGNPDTAVERVFLCEHITGKENKDNEIIRLVREEKIDALLPLEIIDWTLSEYIRDAVTFGEKKVIFEMGHFNLEELGMKHLAVQLRDLFTGRADVHFIRSGDSFQYLVRDGRFAEAGNE